MFVTVSGWLYIVLSLFALSFFKRVHGAGEKMAFLASIAFLLVVGVGLLSRLNWARWLTLGVSLLTWTLGSLAFFWQIVQFFRLSALFPKGFGLGIWVTLLCVVAAWSAYIWLNFKLFEHLNSDEGRFEFDTPETETHAVMKSAALQIAWGVLSMLLVKPGSFGTSRPSNADIAATLEAFERLKSERATSSPETVNTSAERAREQQQAATDSMRRAVEQEEARGRQRLGNANQVKAEEEYQRKARELLERRVRDRSYTDSEFEADKKALERELLRSWETPAGTSPSAYTEPSRQPSSASERHPSAILKCRDASGAISFTQGYCPAGTTLVESPTTD